MQINVSSLITYSINYEDEKIKDKNNIYGHCKIHVKRFRILIHHSCSRKYFLTYSKF